MTTSHRKLNQFTVDTLINVTYVGIIRERRKESILIGKMIKDM